MLISLRAKSQITIPKEIVNSLNLSEGDDLNIVEKSGEISITQVIVCRKKHIDELEKEIEAVKQSVIDGEHPDFDRLNNAFQRLKKSISLQ